MYLSRTTIKKASIFSLLGVALLTYLASYPLPSLGYLNVTSSAPKGLYLIAETTVLSRGQFVIIPLPAEAADFVRTRKWHPAEQTPLLKRVGALPGDEVRIQEEGLFINGSYIGPVATADSEGLPLPRLRGTFVIQPGQFLPLSPYDKSFDGRYFGPVPIASIEHTVTPFFTY